MVASQGSLQEPNRQQEAPLVSVIIPALNEEEYLPRTLARLIELRDTEYPHIEIVVAVGPSTDKTEDIARTLGDVVVNVGIGPSTARNAAAKRASGSVLVFLDADAMPLPSAIRRIAEETTPLTVGTCSMQPDTYRIRSAALSCFKNAVRATLHRGCSELIFCHRDIFFGYGVHFVEELTVGELHRFFVDALAHPGVTYKYLWKARYQFSVRRQEKYGYTRVMLFWIRWFIVKRSPKLRGQLEAEYWREARRMVAPTLPSEPSA
jgi:glycosyltransferase involved in cell wall biosynthesis